MEGLEFICCAAPIGLFGLVIWVWLLGSRRISQKVFWIGLSITTAPAVLLLAWIFYYGTVLEGIVPASAEGDSAKVENLIKWGADPNADVDEFGYPLYAAVTNNHPDVVRVLLKHGADPNAHSDVYGSDPKSLVRIAANAKEWDIVALLKAAGGKP